MGIHTESLIFCRTNKKTLYCLSNRQCETKNLKNKMSKNTKLFEDAIADAKALREVAVANAKAALEESFMPRIQSMFEKRIMEAEGEDDLEERATYEADKDVLTKSLDEMEETDESVDLEELFNSLSEEDYSDDVDFESETMMEEDNLEEEYDLEEILRELEEEDNMTYEGEEIDEDLFENTMFEKASGEESIDEVTVDELRDMIQDAIRAVMGGEEGSAGEEEMSLDMGAEEKGGEGEEDFNLDLDAEAGEEEKPKKKKSKEEELDEIFALYERKKKEKEELDERRKYKGKTKGDLDESAEAVKGAPFGKGGAKSKPGAPYGAAGDKKSGLNGAYKNKLAMKLHEMEDIEEMEDLEELKKAATEIAKKKVEKEKELDEAINVIKTLRGQLNEVNLLNAKLIYVNRLFKENTLTESQKVNVVNSFDKATTLNETKNIYEVLKNTVKSSKATAKTTLKEHKSFASSVIGGKTAKPEIIDANDTITRMQKLAGIIKN